ncbi:PilW family protein [Candidatus Nitrospira bockiana]
MILARVGRQDGFTLVELLIGLIVGTLVVAAAFTALTGSLKATRANDLTVQTQQSARVAMELLAHDIKMAGYGMTGAVGNCATAIVPGENNPAANDTGPDWISMVVPTASAGSWELQDPAIGPFAAITVKSSTGLAFNDVISIGGVTSTTITGMAGNVVNLGTTLGAPVTFPVDTPVHRLQCVTYQVIRAGDANAAVCGGNTPCLVRGVAQLVGGRLDCNGPGSACVSIAEGVEDLQFAYACDGCNIAVNAGVPDSIVDDQGGINGIFDANDFVFNNTWTAAPMVASTIRLVRVNVVAREAQLEQGFGEGNRSATNSTAALVVDDHDPSADAGYDAATYQQFRRRLVTRTVEVRNIGL